MTLTWDEEPTAHGYRIYRVTLPDNWVLEPIADTLALTYVDLNVQAGAVYTYAVASLDPDGNAGDVAEVTCKIPTP